MSTNEPIQDGIKRLLIERGWKIDPDAKETPSGEVREFIHPETGARLAWLDAVWAEQKRESR